MPIDDLIEPIPVTIELFDPTAGVKDTGSRSTLPGRIRKTKVTIQAQVYWDREDSVAMTAAGPMHTTIGSFVVRTDDLAALGLDNFKFNDRIIQIGKRKKDLYVVRHAPFGEWSDIGDSAYIQHFFTDRDPTSKLPGDG